MDDALGYSKSNVISKTMSAYCLTEFQDLFLWNQNENILDFGCGDGDVTLNILLPKLPQDFNQIVGTDVSEEMVNFAKKRNEDPRIQFLQNDIGSSEIPNDFNQHFHHIFSFFSLHWVPDQRLAIANLYNMLKPGGQILMTIIPFSPHFDVFVDLSKNERWAPYMKDFGKKLFPYQWTTDPKKILENLLKQQGFDIQFLKLEEKEYALPMPVFDKLMVSLNSYVKNVPLEEQEDYIEEYLRAVKSHKKYKTVSCDNGESDVAGVYYCKILTVFASKPLYN